jgi:hypothetical protein
LKRQIVHQKDRIEELNDQLQHARAQEPGSRDDDFLDLQIGVQEVVDLGETMVDQGRVPDLPPSPASSSASEDESHPDLVPGPYSPPGSSFRQLRRARDPINLQSAQQIDLEAPPSDPSSVISSDVDSQRQLSSSGSEESFIVQIRDLPAEKRDSDPEEGPSTGSTGTEDSSPVSTLISTDGDFISVHKTKRKIFFNPTAYHESIIGWVRSSRNEIQITALLDPKLPESIISLALCFKLGLVIEKYDEEHDEEGDWKWIRVAGGEGKRSRGRVVVTWSQGGSNRPLKVHCWVFEGVGEEVLVFGKPFMEKRRYYWESDEIDGG